MGHIHTLNDEDVIDRSLQALLDQTYPLEEILVVDNGSVDGTLRRSFPSQVRVIRHSENLGTSGAVVTGMRHALENRYEWIWLFDGDSAPRKEALERLVELYRSFPRDLQAQTWVLACLPVDAATGEPRYGARFPGRGGALGGAALDPKQVAWECDVTIWTGSLFKLAAVERVGLPRADYLLDWGEFEYAHRGRRLGYRTFMHTASLVDHDIGGQPSVIDFPPMRFYYFSRNIVHFWLHEYHRGNLYGFLRESPLVLKHVSRILAISKRRPSQLAACLRGLWDGLRKNMHRRY